MGLFSLAGLFCGLGGAALLRMGLRRLKERSGSPLPATPRRVFYWGLLFPGAAQAYAGQSRKVAIFLGAPWLILGLTSLLSIGAAILAGIVPATSANFFYRASFTIESGLGTAFRVALVSSWAASLAAGIYWAKKLPREPLPRAIPRERAPVLGLGIVLFAFWIPGALTSHAIETHIPILTEAMCSGAGRVARAWGIRARFPLCRHKKIDYLDRLAKAWKSAGREGRAKDLAREAIALGERTCGPDDFSIAAPLKTLGFTHRCLGEYGEAEKHQLRALEIAKKMIPKSLFVAGIYDELGATFFYQRKYNRAENWFRRRLEILEDRHGPHGLDVAETANSLGVSLHLQGKHAAGEPHLLRALEIRKKELGTDHPEVTTTMQNLVSLYSAQRRLAEATATMKSVLERRVSALGLDHPEVATAHLYLASAYTAQGLFAESHASASEAMRIQERTFGPKDSRILPTLAALIEIDLSQGRLGDVARHTDRARTLLGKAKPTADPDTAGILDTLVSGYLVRGKISEAAALAEQSLAIREEVYGKGDIETAPSLQSLALVRSAQHEFGEAEELLKRMIAISTAAFGSDNPAVAMAMTYLANSYAGQFQLNEAAVLLRRSLSTLESSRGRDHPDLLCTLESLAGLHHQQEDFSRGLTIISRAETIAKTAYPPDHPGAAEISLTKGDFLRHQAKFAKAGPLIRHAASVFEKLPDANPLLRASSYAMLGQLHQDLGDPKEAERQYRRAVSLVEKSRDHEAGLIGLLHGLAKTLQRENPTQAEEICRRALSIQERYIGKGHPHTAGSLACVAETQRRQGRCDDAIPLYKEALEKHETASGPDRLETAETLTGLAKCYMVQRKFPDAERLLDRSRGILERSLGKDHPETAEILARQALLVAAQGNVDRAEPVYRQALQTMKNSLGHVHPKVAELQDEWGNLLFSRSPR